MPTWPCAPATRESWRERLEVAGYARRYDLILDLARLWLQVEPASKRAQQVLVGVMIMSNQFDGLARN
jgi:hypothetical protein